MLWKLLLRSFKCCSRKNIDEYRDRLNNSLEPLTLAAHYLYAAIHNSKNLKADEGDDLTSKEISTLKLLVNDKPNSRSSATRCSE